MKSWMGLLVAVVVVVAVVGLAPGSGGTAAAKTKVGKAQDYNPVIDPADFDDGDGDPLPIDNQYMPLEPGTTYHYEAQSEDGVESDDVYVSHNTVDILGVTCLVVEDAVSLDGDLTEFTYDWYAQDQDGNVWYFGEDSTQYENGVPVSTDGSWTAGVDGALPGIVMLADPHPGDSYRQEYQEDEAEDMASVRRLNAKASVPYGDFDQCLETKEWSPLEKGVVEHKVYAPGVGQVFGVEHHGKAVQQVLVSVTME